MSSISELAEKVAGTFEFDLGITHHFSSGVYAKQMVLPKNTTALSHKHPFDHLSILATGSVLVRTDEDERVYTAPACITIKAGMNHAISALENSVWFCIHATDETDPAEVDEVILQKKED